MTLRVGVVGTGWWSDKVHLPAARSASVELVGVFGRDVDRADAVAKAHECTAFRSFEAMLDAVDIIDFAVPPNVQAPLAVEAARAGKHLMLEKPLAGDVESALEVLRAVDEADVSALVFLTRQFDPAIAKWMENAKRQTWHGASIQMITAAMNEVGSPWSQSDWRIEKGGLWDIGPHGLATAIPVLGDVTDVRAIRGRDGLIQAILAHSSGAVSTLTITINAPPPVEILDITLWGQTGTTSQPGSSVAPVEALITALDRLNLMASGGADRSEMNLALASDIVVVLSRIEAEIVRCSA